MINSVNLKPGSFHPYPVYSERDAWQKLPVEVKNFYLSEAQKLKNHEWPSLPASVYLEFYRDGNRSHYEKIYFDRRADLFTLSIAECIEGKGNYLDDIINAIWLICEETTWVIPAHLNHGRPSKGSFYHHPGSGEKTAYPEPRRLHDPEDEIYIDLFAAETGSLISWVYYFLGDALAVKTPEVKRRMEEEVIRRILSPFAEQDYFPWMGLAHNDPVNNWNPWINSNALAAYLVFAPVFTKAEHGVNKAIKSINRFIHFYTDDGGCDEGPSYFGVAGASLLDFIEELALVSDVSYLYKQPKIQNMVSYIYKVYIGKEYYVNYADAPPRVFAAGGTLDRAGKNMGNPLLSSFANYLKANKWGKNDIVTDRAFNIYRCIAAIFSGSASGASSIKLPALAWFPGIQVVTARDNGETLKGFFFSAKGGNNEESHNHNDIGNFILYCDGTPVLVDAGVETYTKFTFSDQRYNLWTMQSGYHNAPTLNGVDQSPGLNFCAKDVSISGNGKQLTGSQSGDSNFGDLKFSLDIAAAYPPSAKIKTYKRAFNFLPGKSLEVTDAYSFSECTSPLILNFLCYEKPAISGNKADLGGLVTMEFDASFTTAIEEIKLVDPKIHNDWQKDFLYRLRLTKKDKTAEGTVTVKFARK